MIKEGEIPIDRNNLEKLTEREKVILWLTQTERTDDFNEEWMIINVDYWEEGALYRSAIAMLNLLLICLENKVKYTGEQIFESE